MLDSEADVGMNGPLIDSEGYPRNDIDIVKVRTARQKIICLMNDHKEIMKKISDALESIHQQNSNGTCNYVLYVQISLLTRGLPINRLIGLSRSFSLIGLGFGHLIFLQKYLA